MFFQTEVLLPGLTRIWDIAHTAMYLVEGREKAILIDTGAGVGDLRACVAQLTDKPLTVLITHGHVDHAMGAGQFERVYMSPLDEAVYCEHSKLAARMDYVKRTGAVQVAESDYQDPRPFGDFLPLYPGDHFDLGGLTVEVLEGAGHTPGSVTMRIPEMGVLLLGDACNNFTFLFLPESSTVAQYRQMLLRLKAQTDGTYQRVLFSHGRGEGAVNMIEEVIAVCDQILRGETDDIPFEALGIKGARIAKAVNFEKMCRSDGHQGNVVYDPNKVVGVCS